MSGADLVFKEAKRLHKMGWAVHWLMPKTKRPVESAWTTGPRKTWEYLEKTYRPGFNVGVRTGTASKIGTKGYLACIDVDIKVPEARPAALQKLSEILNGVKCAEVRSGSGNGSRHLYCVTEKPFKMITVAKEKGQWEICVYSDGRQMALPPSIHPDTGRTYIWKRGIEDAQETPLMHFIEGLRAETDAGAKPDGTGVSKETQRDSLRDFKPTTVELAWLPISDEVRNGIVTGEGVADRSGFLLRASTALFSAGLSQNEVLSVLTDPKTYLGACGYDHAKTTSRQRAAEWVYKYTVKRVSEERSVENVFGKYTAPEVRKLSKEERAAQQKEFDSERDWRQDLDFSKSKGYTPTFKNIKNILTHSVDTPVFYKDLFANRIAYGVGTPWGGKRESYIQDIDMVLIKNWFSESEFSMEPPTNGILETTSFIAHQHAVHPVRDWLASLKWDGVPRVGTWIKDYCEGEAAEPYFSEASKKFLLAMIKRIFEPGCQWDYILILEGHQGKMKSSVARALAGDKWFMDNLPDLKDKDAMLNLQGKWLIELAELANVKRSDHNLVKAYLIRRVDTVRPHYGRIMEDVPRQSVFIGTVNEGEYLKDPTGNRRFWPIKVGQCDVEGIKAVRDQLFAEAMHLYKTENEVLKLSPVAELQAKEAQDDRRVDDEESEMREALVEFMQSKTVDFDFSHFRTKDLFVGVGAPWGPWADKNYAAQTGAQVLRNLGFERIKVKGQRIWKMGAISTIKMRGQTQGADPHPYEVEADFF